MDTLKLDFGPISVKLISDDRICQSVLTGKPFEPDTLMTWMEMCQPGAIVVDVGAYSGLFSILAAKMGAIPFAIEPLPVMQERIKANAALNGVEFEIIRGAASDETGKIRIGYNDRVHLTSGASVLRKSGPGIVVNTYRLDDINFGGPVTAIKVDVERYEKAVLNGAAEILERDRPDLVIEVLDDVARGDVEYMLPKYTVQSFLDKRNLILTSERL
jgi:FkbM family methyltransferase